MCKHKPNARPTRPTSLSLQLNDARLMLRTDTPGKGVMVMAWAAGLDWSDCRTRRAKEHCSAHLAAVRECQSGRLIFKWGPSPRLPAPLRGRGCRIGGSHRAFRQGLVCRGSRPLLSVPARIQGGQGVRTHTPPAAYLTAGPCRAFFARGSWAWTWTWELCFRTAKRHPDNTTPPPTPASIDSLTPPGFTHSHAHSHTHPHFFTATTHAPPAGGGRTIPGSPGREKTRAGWAEPHP